MPRRPTDNLKPCQQDRSTFRILSFKTPPFPRARIPPRLSATTSAPLLGRKTWPQHDFARSSLSAARARAGSAKPWGADIHHRTPDFHGRIVAGLDRGCKRAQDMAGSTAMRSKANAEHPYSQRVPDRPDRRIRPYRSSDQGEPRPRAGTAINRILNVTPGEHRRQSVLAKQIGAVAAGIVSRSLLPPYKP